MQVTHTEKYSLNEPQIETLQRIAKLAKSCRWIDVQFRDNGEFKLEQADFLRDILKTMAIESDPNKNKILIISKYGWPVEGIKGKPIINFIRYVIHGRKLMLYKTWLAQGKIKIQF